MGPPAELFKLPQSFFVYDAEMSVDVAITPVIPLKFL